MDRVEDLATGNGDPGREKVVFGIGSMYETFSGALTSDVRMLKNTKGNSKVNVR